MLRKGKTLKRDTGRGIASAFCYGLGMTQWSAVSGGERKANI